jgi:hypothetical protein
MVLCDDNSSLFTKQSLVANHLIKDSLAKARINGGHWVVKKIDASISVNGPCQANSLPLASAQIFTIFLDPSEVTFR